jgi:hypothetical protein
MLGKTLRPSLSSGYYVRFTWGPPIPNNALADVLLLHGENFKVDNTPVILVYVAVQIVTDLKILS